MPETVISTIISLYHLLFCKSCSAFWQFCLEVQSRTLPHYLKFNHSAFVKMRSSSESGVGIVPMQKEELKERLQSPCAWISYVGFSLYLKNSPPILESTD